MPDRDRGEQLEEGRAPGACPGKPGPTLPPILSVACPMGSYLAFFLRSCPTLTYPTRGGLARSCGYGLDRGRRRGGRRRSGEVEDHLTTNERMEIETLEGIIEREMGSFMAVGKALLTIRENRLYREDFEAFEDYCKGKWGMSRTYANYLVSGSQIAANLATAVALCSPCEIQPIHVQQVRPLVPLKPEQLRGRISLKNFWGWVPSPGWLFLFPPN